MGYKLRQVNLGRLLLRINTVNRKYTADITAHYTKFKAQAQTSFKAYPMFTQLPQDGFTYDQCASLIQQYDQIVCEHIRDKHFSGTIYIDNTHSSLPINLFKPVREYDELQLLYSDIFIRSNLWNSLHDSEFGVGNVISYQVVSIVGHMLGGDINKLMGVVTSGGTQSLMTAARAYCEYGTHMKNIPRNKCTILAPDTIHAGLMKAASAYNFNLVLVKTYDGRINKHEFERVVKKTSNIVAIFCSVPNYPYGSVDDYVDLGRLALRYKIGLHVDACLGGFIVNFNSHLILQAQGVTSVSVDTHKNGLAPKGSSVLITQDLFGRNVLYYSIYTVLDWPGGIYGTPKDEGSHSCVPAFCALITLLKTGKTKYIKIATDIINLTYNIRTFLEQHDVKIIGGGNFNVVAFQVNAQAGSTYKLCDLMKEHGFHLNTLLNDAAHICVTQRWVNDPYILTNFKSAFTKAYAEVISTQWLIEGSTRLYCSIDTVLKNEGATAPKRIENWLLGRHGITDIVKAHFLALFNPYYTE